MICTGFYYLSPRLTKGELMLVKGDAETLFQPGKYFETFPVWYEYIRANYPDEHLIIFNDAASPVPLNEALLFLFLREPYEFIEGYEFDPSVKIHIKTLNAFPGSGYRAMQRNLVEAITIAYKNNDRLLWVDNDCFLNSNLFDEMGGADVFVAKCNDHQMTLDSFCIALSAARLHGMDEIVSLPEYLQTILHDAPHLFRIHAIHEGGLYKLFCYGDVRDGTNINMCHRPTYTNLVKFLKDNPLENDHYKALVEMLSHERFELLRAKTEFSDDCYGKNKKSG